MYFSRRYKKIPFDLHPINLYLQKKTLKFHLYIILIAYKMKQF